MKLFTYGSIILPAMTQASLGRVFVPKQSVFLRGYKIILEKEQPANPDYPNYHWIKLVRTGQDQDIVPGYLVEVSDVDLEALDQWEGPSYQRSEVVAYDRNLKSHSCLVYMQR